MKKFKWDFIEAINFVKKKRREVSTKFEEQLNLWHSAGYSLHSQDGDNQAQKEIAKKYPRSKLIKYL